MWQMLHDLKVVNVHDGLVVFLPGKFWKRNISNWENPSSNGIWDQVGWLRLDNPMEIIKVNPQGL